MTAEPTSTPRRLPRFSLRSLILFVALCGVGYGLWARWEPWAVMHAVGGYRVGYVCRDGTFSPDGKRVYTAGKNNTCHIWDVQTGKRLHSLPGEKGASLARIAVSPDGRWVATLGFEKRVRIWDAATGRMIRELPRLPETVLDVRFSPDGTRLLTLPTNTGNRPCNARLWDVQTGDLFATFVGHRYVIISAAFSPDGKRLVTGGGDAAVRLWDASTGACIHVLKGRFKKGRPDLVWHVKFSHDGSHVVSWAADDTRREWNAATGTSLGVTKLRRPLTFIRSFSHSADRKYVVVPGIRIGRLHHVAYVLNSETGQILAELSAAREGIVESAVFSPDGRHILTTGQSQDSLIYHRGHPERWYGAFWLAEFWLTVVLGVGLVVSVWKDQRAFRPMTSTGGEAAPESSG